MRIAVTYENGNIFQHFGHTEQFKFYDVEGTKIVHEQVTDSHNVDTVICGGIGGGAQSMLVQAGIRLFGGVSGSADEAVKALLAGTLAYDPNVHCEHHSHDHGHSCKEHSCG